MYIIWEPIKLDKKVYDMVPIICELFHLEIWVPINYNNLNNKRNSKINRNQNGGLKLMKRINAQQYKALTSYYNVKIISANDNTVLVKLIGKK